VEIASFNEFTRLIGEESAIAGYDHVILDTAPTGHTLRLLSLPAAWNDFIAGNESGSSCLGPLSGLKEQRLIYERAVKALTDPALTLLVLVTRAETAAFKEAARASAELAALGISNQRLIINGIFTATDRNDPLAIAFEQMGRGAMNALPDVLSRFPCTRLSYQPAGFIGIAALRSIFHALPAPEPDGCAPSPLPFTSDFNSLLDRLAGNGSGVILTMGKGGVGKTTLAAAIAIELARRGFPVHLSTTDPAAHVSDAIHESLPNLQVSRIDPAIETVAHISRVMAAAEGRLDTEARALLEEELRSPCTEEIAVFQAFARMVAQGKDRFVVLDTAPTGHTLLLLDATEAYHREVLRSSSELPEAVRELLPRLRDPNYTRVLLVTLPEATPVHEAAQLQDDLRRAGIEPHAWIVNQSFAAAAPSDPVLRVRASREVRYIKEVIHELAEETVIIPWMDGEHSGSLNLRRFFHQPTQRTV
jgi:arsenite-transporting ATPase